MPEYTVPVYDAKPHDCEYLGRAAEPGILVVRVPACSPHAVADHAVNQTLCKHPNPL